MPTTINIHVRKIEKIWCVQMEKSLTYLVAALFFHMFLGKKNSTIILYYLPYFFIDSSVGLFHMLRLQAFYL